MRWPAMARFAAATSGTAEPRQPHPDLTKQCRDRMIPIVLYVTDEATASASRSPNGMASGLCGNDLLLETRQQPFPFGQGQPQIGDIAEVVGPIDGHDVNRLLLIVGPGFHQPHNPSHAFTSDPRADAKLPLR